jgi:hypothetical protein
MKTTYLLFWERKSTYRKRAIITRGLYIFCPILTAIYIVERSALQTIYLLKTRKSMVYSQGQFKI